MESESSQVIAIRIDQQEDYAQQEQSELYTLPVESTVDIEDTGFENQKNHQTKQMRFPAVPPNLQKLYQIYRENVYRKKTLKKSTEQLIEIQLKAIRIVYDRQRQFFMQQFIDLQQKSKQYQKSKQNYQTRQKQLEKLSKKYRQLKNMQIQSMMMIDQVLMKIFGEFVKNNKAIVSVFVFDDIVTVFVKEVISRKRNRKQGKKQGGVLRKTSQEVEKEIKCVTGLQNQQLGKHYVLRSFKFYKTSNGISFQPMEQLIQIPNNSQPYIGFCMDPLTKYYIFYKTTSIQIIKYHNKQLQLKWRTSTDSPIIFCQRVKNNLLIGCRDGILKIYEIKQNLEPILIKIVVCVFGNMMVGVTHYCLTGNQQIVIFVRQGNAIYEYATCTGS